MTLSTQRLELIQHNWMFVRLQLRFFFPRMIRLFTLNISDLVHANKENKFILNDSRGTWQVFFLSIDTSTCWIFPIYFSSRNNFSVWCASVATTHFVSIRYYGYFIQSLAKATVSTGNIIVGQTKIPIQIQKFCFVW